jgi:hypothetical protein
LFFGTVLSSLGESLRVRGSSIGVNSMHISSINKSSIDQRAIPKKAMNSGLELRASGRMASDGGRAKAAPAVRGGNGKGLGC